MTQEEKQLLTKVLCEMMPYGVMCKIQTCFVFEDGTLRRGSYDKILDLDTVTEINEWKETGELEKFKPYLRPMSSMTEEEKQVVHLFVNNHQYGNCSRSGAISDYLDSIHVDYRGLIEKGLALEAPEGMYD